jgi:heme A synthase
MRKAYSILGYLIAVEVVVQAMAIAYAIAGLGYWIAEDGGVLNKQVMESDDLSFSGIGGFMLHGINGTMVVPLLVLLFLIVSFFTKLPGATKRAAILFGLVAVQVFLGIFSHSLPAAIVLHALNAFAILVVAFTSARRAGAVAPAAVPAAARERASA